jgi:hypothetical protein
MFLEKATRGEWRTTTGKINNSGKFLEGKFGSSDNTLQAVISVPGLNKQLERY